MSLAPPQRKAAPVPKPAAPKPAPAAPKPALAPAPKAAAPAPAPAKAAATASAAPKPTAAPGPASTSQVSRPPAGVQRAARSGVPVEPADSALEREAEAAAQEVVRRPAPAPPTVRQGAQVAGAVARARRPDVVAPPLPPGAEVQAPSTRAALDAAHASPEAGEPLAPTLRATLEDRFGTDLSDVRVHRDGTADHAARELQARAFTEGRHIWLAQGESADDVELMAHEVTHVLQQRGAPGRPARVMRNGRGRSAAAPSPAPPPNEAPAPAPVDAAQLSEAQGRLVPGSGDTPGTIVFDQIEIPGFKLQSHRAALYSRQQGSDVALQYPRGYNREAVPDIGQRDKWRDEVSRTQIIAILERKEETARGDRAAVPEVHYFKYPLRGGQEAFYFGTLDSIATELTLPTWNRRGVTTLYHVDHVVELQLADYRDGHTTANAMWNYELLEGQTNTASGNDLKNSINRRIGSFVEATHGQHGANATELKRRYNLRFLQASGGLAPRSVTRDKFWQREDIESGAHLDGLVASGPSDLGRADRVRVIGRTGGGLTKAFAWNGGSRAIQPRGDERNWLKPFRIRSKQFRTGEAELEQDFGVLNVDVPPDHKAFEQIEPQSFDIARVPGARFAGVLNKASVRAAMRAHLKAKGFSPIEVETFDIENDGIHASGRVASDIPLLRDADIRWRVVAGDVTIYKTFTGPDLPLPAPFALQECDLTLFASTERGLGADGRVAFAIGGVGEGEVHATAATGAPLTFGGHFDFDSRWFDPARVAFSYDAEAGQWSGSGELGLRPNTVPGVESATGRVSYDGTTLTGSLEVVPKLRAIQQGRLDFRYSETEGARFDGRLMLSDAIPNLRGGELQVVLTQPPEGEGWRLAARADLASSFAGFNQQLHVEYDNGGFVVEGGGDFRRGMLAGQVTIGATNYTVDEAGQRGDVPTEVVTAYGSGQVSVTLTPWLTATGRIRLLPNGEIELFGELALPPTLNVFDEISYERRLFELNLDIPIIGFAVAGQRIGIFATIGGGLDLSAGIGPGQLRDTRLNVSYNPAHEDQTTIHGQATFAIPAHAGIRAFIRGALGAGIPVVSAELGLEAGGELGLAGEASAAATVDWAPGRGLVLDATGSIFVEPRFRFDLTGFLEVTADLWITEIDLYSQRWELAAFEVGSALRLGIEFPVHYEEGQPFQVSWDDVRFTLPEIDFGDLMDDVIGRVV